MQKTMKQWLALSLAVWGLASCSQDGSEPDVSSGTGETLTLSLSAEISVDNADTRAINYKLGTNANGQLVPLPQFEDGQLVEVHTIIKSLVNNDVSKGTSVVKTLKWKYDATKKKLVLRRDDGHNIVVPNFNNDNNTKWYISGVIGGVLNGTKVEFMGDRVVKGFDGNAGEDLGSMNIPYAFAWTELTIDTHSEKDVATQSYAYAKVDEKRNAKLYPMGSLIAVRLGNKQLAGDYTFTPEGFSLGSNAWSDQGAFQLDRFVSPHNGNDFPVWEDADRCGRTMYYTFADGHAPGEIAPNSLSQKIYYVWVSPHSHMHLPVRNIAEVRVMMKGRSSRPETETYRDYTNAWFTDYTVEGKVTQGMVTRGKIHTLTAHASHRVALPIEYVTEYNLAGGDGLTDIVTSRSAPKPPGTAGSLRFATSHDNDQSGYYNWFKTTGRYDATYNPDSRSLQAEVDALWGTGKYYVPTMEEWKGIMPGGVHRIRRWSDPASPIFEERMKVGSHGYEWRQRYISEFSDGLFVNNVATVYAIRFKVRAGDPCYSEERIIGHDYDSSAPVSALYTSALDNSMKCAYRFRRIGALSVWTNIRSRDLKTQMIIDVVYLGEESTPTELSAISNDAWWAARTSEGKVISRTFSFSGELSPSRSGSDISYFGQHANYWSTTYSITGQRAGRMHANFSEYSTEESRYPYTALPVRLFTRRDQ